MPKKTAPHVKFRFADGALVCEHCGEKFTPQLPMELSEFIKTGKAFTYLHRDCLPPETTENADKKE